MYFIIHIVSYKRLFIKYYLCIQAFQQICLVSWMIIYFLWIQCTFPFFPWMLWNGWLQICCVSRWSPILDEYHPFLVDLDHAIGWVLQTCLLSWMIIHLGCIPPSILVGIYHVMEWMLQICFLSQWSSNSDAYHPFFKDINHLWNGCWKYALYLGW